MDPLLVSNLIFSILLPVFWTKNLLRTDSPSWMFSCCDKLIISTLLNSSTKTDTRLSPMIFLLENNLKSKKYSADMLVLELATVKKNLVVLLSITVFRWVNTCQSCGKNKVSEMLLSGFTELSTSKKRVKCPPRLMFLWKLETRMATLSLQKVQKVTPNANMRTKVFKKISS